MWWSVRAPWRVVAESVEVLCEASWEGVGGARREVPARPFGEAVASPPRGSREGPLTSGRVVPRAVEAWAETPRTGCGGGRPRDCQRGLWKPPVGVVAELAWVPGRLPQVVVEGAFRATPPGRVRGAARAASRRSSERPSSQRLEVSERCRECLLKRRMGGLPAGRVVTSARATSDPRRRGSGGRLATLCDSRLRHAVGPATERRAHGGGAAARPIVKVVLGAYDRASAGLGDRSCEAEAVAFEADVWLSKPDLPVRGACRGDRLARAKQPKRAPSGAK